MPMSGRARHHHHNHPLLALGACLLLCATSALAFEMRSSSSSLRRVAGRSGVRAGGSAPASCASSEDLIEPTATDPAPEVFPVEVYGNFVFQENVKSLAGSKTHPLREGMSFNKEKPGTTKLQKRSKTPSKAVAGNSLRSA